MSTNQAWSRVMLALMMMSCGAFGQVASDPGEGLRAVPSDVAGVTAVKWWGKLGRSYFVQSSETLLPGSWQYMPVVEDGTDGVCTYNLQTSAERMFVRLVYTDQAPAGGAAAADFDGDGIANDVEVSSSVGLNPLDALQDEDGDGMPDAWEMQHALSRFDGSDGGINGPMPGMPEAPPVPVVPDPQAFYFPDSMGVPIWNQTAYDAALEAYDAAVAAYPDLLTTYHGSLDMWLANQVLHDPDNDGLSNVREFHAGSDPWVADTDGDGFHDGTEVMHGSLPAVASSTPPFRLEVLSGNLQEIIAGTSSSEVVLRASRAGLPLAGKAVRFESASATLLLQPVGGGSAGAIVTMTTNAQGQVAVTLQAPASPALGLVGLAAELTEHAGVAAGFQAAVVEPGLSFLRPDVWAWISGGSGVGSSSSSSTLGKAFVPGVTAVVLSRSSAVSGGTYHPGTPGTTVPGPRIPNGAPVERTDQPDLDEYENTAGETEHFSVRQELVGYDEDEQPIFEPRYSWRKQRMKPGPSVTIPGTPSSVTAYEASNEKYAGGKLVIETEQQVAAKAPKPTFSGSIAGYLGFGELTREDRKSRGSAGGQIDAGAANGDYDTGSWRQFWLFTGVPATEDVTHSFLIKTTSGTVEEAATSYGTFTLTVKKNQTVSTEGDVEGQVPGVSVTDGVASIQPAVPGSDGSAVSIEALNVEVLQHPANVTSGSAEPPSTQSVRLCRWLDAYDSFGEFAASYPRYDRDRFRIKVPADSFPGQSKITIKLATKKPQGTNDPEDAQTAIECEMSGGFFISKPMILVGDGSKPNGIEGDDGWSQVPPNDEQLNDVTHIASPGGRIEIELPLNGNPKIEFSIAKYTDKVKVKSYVVRSPSSNSRMPTDILTYLSDGVQRAKDVFKQAHVKIEYQGPYDCVLTDAELDLINSDRGDGARTLLMTGGNVNYLEDGESQLVFDKIRELDGGGTDIVRVLFVDCDFVGRNPNAVGLTIRDPFTGENKYGVYEGFIVIPIINASDVNIPAHEIGHALSMLHPPAANGRKHMLMIDYSTSTWTDRSEFYEKRFRKADLDTMLSSPRPLFVLPIP